MPFRSRPHTRHRTQALCTTLALCCIILACTLPAHPQNITPGHEKSETQKDYERLRKKIEKRAMYRAEAERLKALYGDNSEWSVMNYEVVNGDTIFLDAIKPAYIFGTVRGNYRGRAWRQYRRLVYNFKRVYPYALEARKIIREADSVIAVSNFSEKQRDEYIDAYQKKLFRHFEKPLKKLSVSQGRLLLKLIDRELGRTSFYIIREYRGRLSAGFWQTVAKIFGNDLKKPYDRFGEDRATEDLVELYQNGAFDALYYSMFWK